MSLSLESLNIELDGQDILAWRQSLGLSQDRLARMLDVSHVCVYLWEKNKRTPSPQSRGKLAKLMRQVNRYKKNQEEVDNNNV